MYPLASHSHASNWTHTKLPSFVATGRGSISSSSAWGWRGRKGEGLSSVGISNALLNAENGRDRRGFISSQNQFIWTLEVQHEGPGKHMKGSVQAVLGTVTLLRHTLTVQPLPQQLLYHTHHKSSGLRVTIARNPVRLTKEKDMDPIFIIPAAIRILTAPCWSSSRWCGRAPRFALSWTMPATLSVGNLPSYPLWGELIKLIHAN